ncbi:hypothetical protein [Denitromonas iodatirespirans]|uniref:Spermidine synthase n=1 Tax=Denitromonas iodatirespirans TaxID=2795389 RepID=A0A944DNG2_DENI1|nr:hypothetical protein [Denitromonas iodatirespirans]MBT0961834.1 hypothetical protein [Denitromonas iodatirespirans]
MAFVFEELDFQHTPLGDISLRRRAEPRLAGRIVYEVKLNDDFLMSSLFTESEIQLARLGLAPLSGALDVVVGGLGLGYTAITALENPAVRSLRVIDVMQPVIDWHRQGRVPLGEALVADPRTTLMQADFFAVAASPDGSFDPAAPEAKVHAVLLDIDHSPRHWLNPGNQAFYGETGFRHLAAKIHPGGVFAVWSNDPPDADFTRLLGSVFVDPQTHVVPFPNPYTGGESSCTVYVARTPAG